MPQRHLVRRPHAPTNTSDAVSATTWAPDDTLAPQMSPAETPAPAREPHTPEIPAEAECAAHLTHDFGRIRVLAGQPAILQPKLQVGQPDDPYEQEADRVADAVTHNGLGLDAAHDESRSKTPAAPAMPAIRAATAVTSGAAQDTTAPALEERLHASESGGEPLAEEQRAALEPRMGMNFARVRVHTDSAAADMSQDMQARAFTIGEHIYFGAGHCQPETAGGQWLLAHELTHVGQQTGEATDAASQRVSGAWIQRDTPDAGASTQQSMSRVDQVTQEWASEQGGGPQTNADFLHQFVHDATFLGLPIRGGIHDDYVPLLRQVEQTLGFTPGSTDRHGVYDLSGFQGDGFHGLHSWGMALDINTTTDPYIMHESGERQLDAQLAPVYQRIAWFILGRNSVIPDAIRHPESLGGTAQTQASQLYDRLQEESRAMQTYFSYMQDLTALQNYISTPDGLQRYQLITQATEPNQSPGSIDVRALQQQMMADFAVLTSHPGPLIQPPENDQAGASAQPPLPYPQPAPLTGRQDRPFDHSNSPRRTPLSGFLDLQKDLVMAMVQAGLRWGAIGFGPESGDVMHFDLANQPVGQRMVRAINAVNARNQAH